MKLKFKCDYRDYCGDFIRKGQIVDVYHCLDKFVAISFIDGNKKQERIISLQEVGVEILVSQFLHRTEHHNRCGR